MTEITPYQDKRNDFFIDATVLACSLFTSIYYLPSYRNLQRLKPLKESGFVLLPNHQSNMDIIFEGITLHKAIQRKGYYVMKNSLPSFLDYLGGIRTIRRKDIVKPETKDDRKVELERAKKQREYVLDKLHQLLSKEEIVVLHQQGNRAYKKPYEINLPNLKKLLITQTRLGRQIPFVPLTISYEDVLKPMTRVIIDVGNPIQVPDNGLETLAEHLMKEIHVEF